MLDFAKTAQENRKLLDRAKAYARVAGLPENAAAPDAELAQQGVEKFFGDPPEASPEDTAAWLDTQYYTTAAPHLQKCCGLLSDMVNLHSVLGKIQAVSLHVNHASLEKEDEAPDGETPPLRLIYEAAVVHEMERTLDSRDTFMRIFQTIGGFLARMGIQPKAGVSADLEYCQAQDLLIRTDMPLDLFNQIQLEVIHRISVCANRLGGMMMDSIDMELGYCSLYPQTGQGDHSAVLGQRRASVVGWQKAMTYYLGYAEGMLAAVQHAESPPPPVSGAPAPLYS